jgi:hypothetical protein
MTLIDAGIRGNDGSKKVPDGVPGPLIEIFLHEHRNRPWRGRLLTLGRQTIVADAPRLHHLLAAHDIPWDRVRAAYDNMTVDNMTVAASNVAGSQLSPMGHCLPGSPRICGSMSRT